MSVIEWTINLSHRDEHILSQLYVRRFGRVFMYSGLVLSGIFLTIEPSGLTVQQVGTGWTLAWAWGIIVGAGMSLYSAATDEWIGEYSGLPLLASCLGLYGFSAIAGYDDKAGDANYVLLAFGCIVLSFTSGLCARWRDVQNIKKLASQGDQTRGG